MNTSYQNSYAHWRANNNTVCLEWKPADCPWARTDWFCILDFTQADQYLPGLSSDHTWIHLPDIWKESQYVLDTSNMHWGNSNFTNTTAPLRRVVRPICSNAVVPSLSHIMCLISNQHLHRQFCQSKQVRVYSWVLCKKQLSLGNTQISVPFP